MIIEFIGLRDMKEKKKMRNYLRNFNFKRIKGKRLILMIHKIDLLILLMSQEIQQDYFMIKMIE